MRKIFLLGLVAVVIGWLIVRQKNLSPALPSPEESLIPEANSSPLPQGIEIAYQGETYVGYFYAVRNAQRLMLKANFEKQEKAETLKETNHCQFLINGGFYDTDNKPIGWWKSGDKTLAEPQKNTLFNGYIYLQGEKIKIGPDYVKTARWGLQTGPLLFIDGQARRLMIKNDELRRRVVAVTTANVMVFLAITLKDSSFEGPYLGELPTILQLIEEQIKTKFVDAINLDGGSASAFLSPDVSLHEANPIGSFFCLPLKN